MSGTPKIDRRTIRRQETLEEIVAAAQDIVREHGLAGLSMRDLGERVGMRGQSIYSYFASKNEIYDAMFFDGYEDFTTWMDAATSNPAMADDPPRAARVMAHAFVEFCTTDPVRHQLLFQRTIPGFEPSPKSYELAVQALGRAREQLSRLGTTDPELLDLWTAVLTGLAAQQISNDPGGDRWKRLVDRAVDMLLATTLTDNTSEKA